MGVCYSLTQDQAKRAADELDMNAAFANTDDEYGIALLFRRGTLGKSIYSSGSLEYISITLTNESNKTLVIKCSPHVNLNGCDLCILPVSHGLRCVEMTDVKVIFQKVVEKDLGNGAAVISKLQW